MIILMGSASEAAREAIDYLNSKRREGRYDKSVHLYRPFSIKHLLAASVPASRQANRSA
jgi:pyruvate-ferredoxin/flavodoxin oxidoreductase